MKLVSGLKTGFRCLDELTGGLQSGELVLLTSRPGLGKSALALSMIQNICILMPGSVAFFSLEMEKVLLETRILASLQGLPTRRNTLSSEDSRSLAIKRLSSAKLYIDDTPNLSIREFLIKANRLKGNRDIDVIFLDYLQLMESTGNLDDNRDRLRNICIELKQIAVNMEIPIVVLYQLPHAAANRIDFSPRPSDFKGSLGTFDDIFSTFDTIIQLHREDYYRPTTANRGLAQLYLLKNPHGPLACIELNFFPEMAAFIDRLPIENEIALPNITSICNREVKLWLAKHPQYLRNTPPRVFEEIIADVFRSQGYSVELTTQTRDGGIDLVAVRKQWPNSEFRLIVECKRYSERNTVGVHNVRGMLFLLEKFHGDRAILATTSYFSRDAWIEIRHPSLWRVSLKDFNSICEWLKDYHSWLKYHPS